MPRRSRATSMIRRLVAACDISMSDFGLVCWEAGIRHFPWTLGILHYSMMNLWRGKGECSCKADTRCEPGSGRVFSCSDLAAIGRLHPQDFDAAVGARYREAIGLDGDDLPHLAGNPLWVARRQRFRFEHLEVLAVQRRPRAGRRIASADEIVDLPPRLAPVDAGVIRRAAALIGRLALILLDAWRLAG